MTLLKELARIILIFVRKKLHANESHHFMEGYKTRKEHKTLMKEVNW